MEIALSYLDKLEHAIGLPKEQPYYGAESRNYFLKKMRFRVLHVENHLVFYKVRERDHAVIIYAVVDSRRNYVNLIF
ncbi:type II toxin-antitoxin system RelE/ParE family toxin [Lacrimispora celerecrescens]|uniref:type II toxin-antitoxin system RelE/ParE family toxin n=1 Tax=Lacrimispora celerecrescens TaxID=29354 RepID=UPI001FA7C720